MKPEEETSPRVSPERWRLTHRVPPDRWRLAPRVESNTKGGQ